MGSFAPFALNVIVVGGGIGGLSAAIALRRAGHHVTVFERWSADVGAGAGIGVIGNAALVLHQWGLKAEKYGMTRSDGGILVDGKSLEYIRDTKIGEKATATAHDRDDVGNEVGVGWLATRRDLRQMLRDEAQRSGVSGEGGIDIIYGKEVVDYDAEKPAVLFRDGTWLSADLVVACDGIHSKAARHVCGTEALAQPLPLGFSAFRLLIATEELEEVRHKYGDLECIKKKFEGNGHHMLFGAGHPGNGMTGKLVVWWSCREGAMQCFDVLIPDNEKYARKEDWLARCDKQVLQDEFAGFHPVYTEIFKRAEEPMLWKIHKREVLETMHKGGLCLLGDALHPMPPYRAQGGSQTIEDAGALEICLSGMTRESELSERLDILAKLRLPRYGTIQTLSSVRQDEPDYWQKLTDAGNQCRRWFAGKDQSQCKAKSLKHGTIANR
jgi:salicylate hydroxylase